MPRKRRPRGDVYLLHFNSPISPGNHTCQHYVGFAVDLLKRLDEHEAGKGSRLTEVAKDRGIGFRVARIWKNKTRAFERRIKKWKMGPRLCPVCCARAALQEAA